MRNKKPVSRYQTPSRPRYSGPRRKKQAFWLIGGLLALGVLVFLAIQLRVWLVSRPYRLITEEQAPKSQVIVILGAKVEESGAVSPALRDRLALGLALYQQGKAPTILVTGDGQNQSRNEVEAMEQYLLEQNVPQEAIVKDPRGLNTYASLYRAKHKYGFDSALIVTQNYHLGRSLYLGRCLGLDCYGLGSTDAVFQPVNIPYNYAREALARIKAFFNAEIQQLEVPLKD